jgi:2-polyprenyl-3-methyl-5-hydroxy-6-metoxy-1,4-benzoquinol methylase
MIAVSDIVQWDIRTWAKAVKYWEQSIDWSKPIHALELGAREGGLSLWLASKGASVVCSDYRDAEEQALPLHKKHEISSKITYQNIDATDIPFENHFDLVIFKSIIGGIGRGDSYENQEKVFQQIYKSLKPGGKLLFAENLTATSLHKMLRKKNKWGSYWRYITLEELDEFLKEYTSTTVKTTGVLGTLGRNECQKGFLTFVDEMLLNPILPSKFHYVAYGIAEK